jgi:hypothetical protein
MICLNCNDILRSQGEKWLAIALRAFGFFTSRFYRITSTLVLSREREKAAVGKWGVWFTQLGREAVI